MKLIILHFQIYHYINIQYGSKNEILKVLREKKGLLIYRSPLLSYTGFEPVTHALKGRCSTY